MSRDEVCIKVDKRAGEKMRRFLTGRSLLDPARKIMAGGASVCIPVCRCLSAEELEAAGRIAGVEIEICREKLPEHKKKLGDLSDLLKDVIPAELLPQLPRSHDLVGDILLLESLQAALLPYKAEIGSALLKLNPGVTTILLKTGSVEGEFRIPQLEVIAGAKKFETIHKEYGVNIKVDLSKAYFSPRLGYERRRVAMSISDGETVVDMFAGVGPFSLMIAKKAKTRIYSIDLNPDAILLLKENIPINRLRGEIVPICGDAKEVAKMLHGVADHVIMNLPASSLEFLDAAYRFLKKSGGTIHLYMFSGSSLEEVEAQFIDASKNMYGEFAVKGSRVVKPVAPRKWQIALDIEVKTPAE